MYHRDAFAAGVGRTLLSAALSGSMVANGMAAEPGYGPVFRHAALEYMSSREFPQIELEVGGSIAVQSVRLCFRAQQHRDFYYVEMTRKDKDNRFVALLPMPLVETAEVVYYFVVIDSAFRQFVSAQFTSRVAAAAVAGSVSGGTPVLKLKPVRPGSVAPLRGFRPDGVVGVPTSNTSAQAPTPAPSPTPASRSTASKERAAGSGGHGLVLGVVGGAAAGLLGVMALNKETKPTPAPPIDPVRPPVETPEPITITPTPILPPEPEPSPFLKYYGTYRILLTKTGHCFGQSQHTIVITGGAAGRWLELRLDSKGNLVCSGTILKNGQFQCSFPDGVSITGLSDGVAITGNLIPPGQTQCTYSISGQKTGG